MTRDRLRDAIDALAEGRALPPDTLVHVSRETTQADWDALDPNSYETTCGRCSATIVGQFGPDGECEPKCLVCGSTETTGGLTSPAGAFHLAMHDPAMWE